MVYSEMAKIASDWWSKNIKKPSFDNGDESENGAMMSLMMKSLVKEVTEEQIDKFKLKLAEYIENELNKSPYHICLDVDYHPCKILHDIAKLCEISEDNFPIKTNMTINRNHVSASLGYCGKSEILYSTIEYWENKLKYLEKELENYKDKEKYVWINDEDRKTGIETTLNEIDECKNKISEF